jgi:hypothetical protein
MISGWIEINSPLYPRTKNDKNIYNIEHLKGNRLLKTFYLNENQTNIQGNIE